MLAEVQKRHHGPGAATQNQGDEQSGDEKSKAKAETVDVADMVVAAVDGLGQEIVVLGFGAGCHWESFRVLAAAAGAFGAATISGCAITLAHVAVGYAAQAFKDAGDADDAQ